MFKAFYQNSITKANIVNTISSIPDFWLLKYFNFNDTLDINGALQHNNYVAVHYIKEICMQKEFTENLTKLYQCVSKPVIDLTELNINTLNNIAKSTNSFEDLSQAKKPEDILSAQVKLANAACLEATRYTQKAMEIGLGAISEAGKIWAESFNKATNKASDFAKTATTNKGKE